MSRVIQQVGYKGSLKWIQRLINDRPHLINDKIKENLNCDIDEKITWLSPLKNDEFAEYRDIHFLERLDVRLYNVPLNSFWPANGPQWDALAKTSKEKVILVEAKAHITELSSSCAAKAPNSINLIQKYLQKTKDFLESKSQLDWTQSYYQYTNRLAHLYLLRVLNNLPAYLVFIYFIGDYEMNGPKNIEEWQLEIRTLKENLDIEECKFHKYIAEVFVDVASLQ